MEAHRIASLAVSGMVRTCQGQGGSGEQKADRQGAQGDAGGVGAVCWFHRVCFHVIHSRFNDAEDSANPHVGVRSI